MTVPQLVRTYADVFGEPGRSDAAWQAHQKSGHESIELVALLLVAGAIPTEQAFELARADNNLRALILLERTPTTRQFEA